MGSINGIKKGERLQPLPAACQKVFFDKLRAVFQNLKSSEKPVIANERHP